MYPLAEVVYNYYFVMLIQEEIFNILAILLVSMKTKRHGVPVTKIS